ncbi:MAG: hypothetical protein JWL82_192 [Parcubacteria group bacterium]|nr:hypothetical protein [Parcubacteria group bacterium]
MTHIVFDIGGTHMRVAAVTGDGIGPVSRVHTPQDPEEAMHALVDAVRSVSIDVDSVIGGVAAIVAEDGSIVFSTNLPEWGGYALAAKLTLALAAHVTIRNDAELAGLGEAVYGAGKGYGSVAYLGIGSGVGTSRIIDGNIEPHSSDGSMRYGIITLQDGRTLEECIGGKSLETRYGNKLEALPASVWKELTPLLLEGIQNMASSWNPDVIVLGGSLVNEKTGFNIDELIRLRGDNAPPLFRASLGDSSGLYGAKALAEQ